MDNFLHIPELVELRGYAQDIINRHNLILREPTIDAYEGIWHGKYFSAGDEIKLNLNCLPIYFSPYANKFKISKVEYLILIYCLTLGRRDDDKRIKSLPSYQDEIKKIGARDVVAIGVLHFNKKATGELYAWMKGEKYVPGKLKDHYNRFNRQNLELALNECSRELLTWFDKSGAEHFKQTKEVYMLRLEVNLTTSRTDDNVFTKELRKIIKIYFTVRRKHGWDNLDTIVEEPEEVVEEANADETLQEGEAVETEEVEQRAEETVSENATDETIQEIETVEAKETEQLMEEKII